MSRRVRCSNGKRAGFVNAKIIRCFYITSDKYKKLFSKNQKLKFHNAEHHSSKPNQKQAFDLALHSPLLIFANKNNTKWYNST